MTAQSAVMSRSASSIAESIRRPSRSSLMSLIVSMSRLSYWTTTRPGMVARSSGAMSMSGAAVISIPPVWMDRWRGNPSMRAVSSSHRSHGVSPAVEGRAAAEASADANTMTAPVSPLLLGSALIVPRLGLSLFGSPEIAFLSVDCGSGVNHESPRSVGSVA